MAQKLVLPFKKSRINSGYKMQSYYSYWKCNHYGCDYGSYVSTGDNVLASGMGTVVTTGYDYIVGNTVCIVYKDVINHFANKSRDLVARYMHLKSIAVKNGQTVKAGDVLGVEGDTGHSNWDVHLHIEFDIDTKFPNHSPQVSGSNIIKRGIDSTVNPSHIFYRREDQILVNGGTPGWTTSADYELPVIKNTGGK